MKQPIFERAFMIGNAPSLKLCKWCKSLIRKIEVQKRKNEVQKMGSRGGQGQTHEEKWMDIKNENKLLWMWHENNTDKERRKVRNRLTWMRKRGIKLKRETHRTKYKLKLTPKERKKEKIMKIWMHAKGGISGCIWRKGKNKLFLQ